MMYSLATVKPRSAVDESSAAAATSSPPQAMTAVAAISDAPAATKDAAAPADYFASPLWVIAFGMAVFFGIVVVLIASGA